MSEILNVCDYCTACATQADFKLHIHENLISNLQETCDLVDIISPFRSDTYCEWLRIGWCLRNIDSRLLDCWIQFSKQSKKYKSGECEKLWNLMRPAVLCVGVLHLWAKSDDPIGYNKLMLSAKERLIYKSEIDDIDIAKVVHYMYKYEYAYTSGKLGWYELKNNRWIHSAKNVFSLRSKLTNEIVGEFKKMMKTMSQNATFATEHYHQERYIEHAIHLSNRFLQHLSTGTRV
jgi:hypothetical protein